MNLARISVIVTAFNEGDRIDACLESVRGFGELVLVDSFSDDDTVAVARRHGAVVWQRPYRSAARQKNWALERVRHDWVLILDADERLGPGLREEIEALEPDRPGYWIRRRSRYLGRVIRGCGWQRDRVLRLFDRRHGRYDRAEVHEEVELDAPPGELRGVLEHDPYRGITHHLEKINQYTSRSARDLVARRARGIVPRMLVNPPARFVRMYVVQRGWRDGWPGLVLCTMAAWSVFLKYAKAWERRWTR